MRGTGYILIMEPVANGIRRVKIRLAGQKHSVYILYTAARDCFWKMRQKTPACRPIRMIHSFWRLSGPMDDVSRNRHDKDSESI